jgi:hypothetical protein
LITQLVYYRRRFKILAQSYDLGGYRRMPLDNLEAFIKQAQSNTAEGIYYANVCAEEYIREEPS